MSKLLTIGMATYDDYDGVFFTIQSLRMYHPICSTNQVEFVVIDNNPKGKHSESLIKFLKQIGGVYVPYDKKNTTFVKYEVVKYAKGKYVIILDCHVLLSPDSIDVLLNYYKENPDCRNLVQGVLIYNDLKNKSSHFDEVWRGNMYGIWAFNKVEYDKGKPFSIPMQGMGFLSFEHMSWPGINENFTGFGGEEGYIAERFRMFGGDNICIPQVGWLHRFDRPNGTVYRNVLTDRVFNYYLGWMEIHKDENHIMIKNITDHFKDKISDIKLAELLNKAKTTLKLN